MKLPIFHRQPHDQTGFTIIELLIATVIFALVMLLATATIIYVSKTYIKGQVESQTQLTAQTILSTIANDIKYSKGSTVTASVGQAPATVNGVNGPYYFCIGDHVYVYQLDTELSPSYTGTNPMYAAHDLIVYTSPSCPSPTIAKKLILPETGGVELGGPLNTLAAYGGATRELLSTHQRLGQLSVVPIGSQNGVTSYQVSITVAYGDDDLLTDDSLIPSLYNSGPRAIPPVSPGSSTLQTQSPIEYYDYSCVEQTLGGNFCAVSSLTTVVTSRIN
jgi:prepilin-type N-terminal cleavage/methylation domain-containing protein